MLHIDSAQLLLGWEALQLPICNGPHEGGLTSTVGATQTVTLTTLQVQTSIVQQDLATCMSQEAIRTRALFDILSILLKSGKPITTLEILLTRATKHSNTDNVQVIIACQKAFARNEHAASSMTRHSNIP